MKKQLIALAAAAAIAPAAFAGNASFGGDANVEGYMLRTDVDGNDITESDLRGYTNRIRVKGTYKTDGNVSVNTRIILNDSSWTGDNHSGGVQGAYANSANDAVAVDYGYIQAPILGWTFRFGRQVANWGNCFLTCDDRRDRILAMKRFGGTTLIFLNDKRQSTSDQEAYNLNTTTLEFEPASTSEGDLYTAAAVGVINGWQWGLLAGKWIGEESYILDEVYAISPFVKGKAGPVKLEGTLNILGGGDDDYAAFRDTVFSFYVKAGMQAGPVMVEGQIVYVNAGSLIAPGFDSFSMLINNNPDNAQSSVSYHSMGGLGKMGPNNDYAAYGYGEYTTADDEMLIGARISGKAGKIGWKAAVTHLTVENEEEGYEEDWSAVTLDGGLTYSVAKTTELYFNVAMANVSATVLNVDTDTSITAATIGINTTF